MAFDLIEIFDNAGGNSFVGMPDPGITSKSLNIWANNDRVHVEYSGELFKKGEITIMNITGQPILREQLESKLHNEFILNTKPGYYIVKVITDGNLTVEKILLF
jgi:hypothetical protein